jgi:hypothetical protein
VNRSTAFGTWVSAVSTALSITAPTGAIGAISEGSEELLLP